MNFNLNNLNSPATIINPKNFSSVENSPTILPPNPVGRSLSMKALGKKQSNFYKSDK